VKAKVREIGAALGFPSKDFDVAVDSGELSKQHFWTAWNDKVSPPWASAYTTNINATMNYWPAESTNLSECHEPFLRFPKELAIDGAKTAQQMYKRPGGVLHHNTTIWRDTQPVDGNAKACFWTMGGAWVCSHLWEHYQFTRDEKFLREQAYPVMKGAAEFLAAWLVDDGSGHLVTPIDRNNSNEDQSAESKISRLLRESPGLARRCYSNVPTVVEKPRGYRPVRCLRFIETGHESPRRRSSHCRVSSGGTWAPVSVNLDRRLSEAGIQSQ